MSNQEFQFERLAIVGVGLIGGSIAAAAKSRGLARSVLGYGRNLARLEAARARGIIDEVCAEPAQLRESDLVVVCTPVDQIAADVSSVLASTSPDTIVTDAGSVKGTIIQQVATDSSDSLRFIGSHPLAGSHLTGFENADAQLYQDRLCIITPTAQNDLGAIARVAAFWKGLGMRVTEMSAEEHDRILVLTSHLPHLAAAAVAANVEDDILEYAATGYRDTTRVAAGDPDLWTAIFSQNADQLTRATDQLIETLQKFRNALVLKRDEDVRAFLKIAQQHRHQFKDRDSQQNTE